MTFYRYDWDTVIIILPTIIIFILSPIISRNTERHYVATIIMSTAFGFSFGFIPEVAKLYKTAINTNIILSMFCPMITVKLIFCSDTYMFRKSVMQILILSTVGFALLVLSMGSISEFALSLNDFNFVSAALLGMLYHVCDVPEIFKEIHGVKNLELLMICESYITMVFITITISICTGFYDGYVNEFHHFVCLYIRYTVVAFLPGLLFGMLFSLLLRKAYNDRINAILVTIASSYFGYIFAEHYLFSSGVITSGVIMYILSQERSGLSPFVEKEVRDCLNQLFDIVHVITVILSCFISSIYYIAYYDDVELIMASLCFILHICFRAIIFAIFASVLSRLGYGFNFTSLVVVAWRPTRGPLSLLLTIKLMDTNFLDVHRNDAIIYIYTSYFFECLFIRMLQKATLDKFHPSKFSLIHQNNVSNAINIIQKRRETVLSVLKMNKFFSGANWTMINEKTMLANPYGKENEYLFENIFSHSTRLTTCPYCYERLHVQPTKLEIREMTSAASSRVLKAQRISFMQQFDQGYLSKPQIRELVYATDLALDRRMLLLNVEDLFRDFKESRFSYRFRWVLSKCRFTEENTCPDHPFKKLCFYVSKSILFNIISFIVTMVLVGKSIEVVVRYYRALELKISSLLYIMLYTFLILECLIRICGYSEYSFQDGLRKYLNNKFLRIDLLAIIFNTVNLYVKTFRYIYGQSTPNVGIILLEVMSCIRILNLMQCIGFLYPPVLARYERKLDEKAYCVYTIGKSVVVSFDEVIHQLPHLTDDDSIREMLKKKLNADKVYIIEQLGLVLKKRPWISAAVETKQSIRCTLKAMKAAVQHLRNAGLTDNYETLKLNMALDERFKGIQRHYFTMSMITPLKLYFEVPWQQDGDEVKDYLLKHLTNKIWDSGVVVMDIGDVFDGIYIIVEGMFKITYQPIEPYLQNLYEKGNLPVKEFITSNNFQEEQIDFAFVGNTIGALSVLTERESSSLTVCYTPARALIIPKKWIFEAMKLNPHPIQGLWSRLWKEVCFNLVQRFLLDSIAYQTAGPEKIRYIMEKAFVPNLSNFETLVLNEFVQDVILVEGAVVDHVTKEVYKAPCYMSRTIQKYLFPREFDEVVLCIIPVKDIDVLDLMFRLEQDSQLVLSVNSALLIQQYWWQRSRSANTISPILARRDTARNVNYLAQSINPHSYHDTFKSTFARKKRAIKEVETKLCRCKRLKPTADTDHAVILEQVVEPKQCRCKRPKPSADTDPSIKRRSHHDTFKRTFGRKKTEVASKDAEPKQHSVSSADTDTTTIRHSHHDTFKHTFERKKSEVATKEAEPKQCRCKRPKPPVDTDIDIVSLQ